MTTATQAYVNERVFPIERAVDSLTKELNEAKQSVEDLKIQVVTRDADLQRAEQRFEELANRMKELEKDQYRAGSEDSAEHGGRTHKTSTSLMRHPALRNLEPYTGNHLK